MRKPKSHTCSGEEGERAVLYCRCQKVAKKRKKKQQRGFGSERESIVAVTVAKTTTTTTKEKASPSDSRTTERAKDAKKEHLLYGLSKEKSLAATAAAFLVLLSLSSGIAVVAINVGSKALQSHSCCHRSFEDNETATT